MQQIPVITTEDLIAPISDANLSMI